MLKKIKKITFLSIAGILLASSTAAVFWGFSVLADKLGSVSRGETPSLSSIKSFPNLNLKESLDPVSTSLKKDNNGNTNVLLIGISGEEYISGNLADTIILTVLNEENNNADLFSIPRDLWVKDPNENFQKINEFYKIAGGEEKPSIEAKSVLQEKVEEITGIEVHYTAIVNLAGIEKFIDIIGGIETEEGHMNGKEALSYIRDRSRPGGDFDRMSRQQKLLMSIFDKLESGASIDTSDSAVVVEIFTILDEYFAMDIPLLKVSKLSNVVMNLDTKDVGLHTITPAQDSLLYSDTTVVGKQELYTLHPTAGREDYSEIQEFILKNIQEE